MNDKDPLGTRMKENYENRYRFSLTRRMPVIVRLDGKAFHSFTRNLNKPFDEGFMALMQSTAKMCCEEIQGCKLAYVQSDEISLLLTDYDKLDTQAWFDYNLQKMCSVSASIATSYFNKNIGLFLDTNSRLAQFDSRVFNIPKEEVCNYFLWRQQDSTRNSIQLLAQANFSQKQLHKLNCSQIQDKLMLEKQINWNDLETYKKRGSCVLKGIKWPPAYGQPNEEFWKIDKEIPIFSQDRQYIERFVFIGEDE